MGCFFLGFNIQPKIQPIQTQLKPFPCTKLYWGHPMGQISTECPPEMMKTWSSHSSEDPEKTTELTKKIPCQIVDCLTKIL